MPYYQLHALHWQDFEELVVLLCHDLLGKGTQRFSPGPAGKDRAFPGYDPGWGGHLGLPDPGNRPALPPSKELIPSARFQIPEPELDFTGRTAELAELLAKVREHGGAMI